ncbi:MULTISPECIES: hypothetical protein [unclassified Novosphingobium]|uniref:hypothetical protein n=1 Tax=unclassified Novosphingobium TaxID=2644732 RepID=UPI00146F71F4|nr:MULTISPECIES: hypothetical protein [unclassified Novosphingobium]NMN07512.1 hypothetical protein [Novosphingobium sp. SG919]NMN89801.1 hypothetical protein [Novosphingobium sp. SG916]
MEILQKATDGSLFDALFDEYGRFWFEPDDPTIELLATLHNDGDVDLLALITPEALEPHKGHRFFQGQHVYQALIARLDASAETLLNVVEALRVAADQAGAAGLPVEEFAKWCGGDPKRPAELLSLIDAGVENADRYLVIAIKYGVEVDAAYFTDRAYQFLEAESETLRLGALNALGQIALPGDADWDRLIAALNATLIPDPGDVIRGAILQVVARRLKGAPSARVAQLEAIAISAITPGGANVLHEAAGTVALAFADVPSRLVDRLLDALRMVEAEHRSTIDLIDLALMKLVEVGETEKARLFVEQVLCRDERPLKFKQFDSLIHKLFQTGGPALEDWVVAWLRGGVFELCNQMDKAMFGAGVDEVTFAIDFARFDLREAEYAYLARKTIATFFLKPMVMASILTSLLRSAAPAPAAEIEALLIDPVLMNYSGVASDYLKPVADQPADPAAPAAQRALDGLAAYIDGLKSIGKVRELHPSERERQLEWERHSDSMNEAMRAARKQSIFGQIASDSLMLYGNRAITWVDHPTEPPRRIETKLASIDTSFEMPRIDIVDPLGLQLMLLHFRAERPPV